MTDDERRTLDLAEELMDKLAASLNLAAMELDEAAAIIADTLPNTGSIFRAAAKRHRQTAALAEKI